MRLGSLDFAFSLHKIVLFARVENNVEINSMGHISFLVKVELTWVQDPGSSPNSS